VRVAFFGTPEPAVLALEALLASRHEVVCVVTRPDRPRGRSGRPEPPPVAARARTVGLPLVQPETPREESFAARLASFRPDAGAVVAYGHILPPEVLAVPPRGFVNVHFSLLPRYRGAAPVQRAIMAGERETGVTTFLLEPTLDTGPVLLRERVAIGPEDTAGSLLERLAPLGARLLVRSLDALEAGTARPVPQDDALATPAPKVSDEETWIDWRLPARRVVDLVRALDPAPGARTRFRGRLLKVWRARAVDAPGGVAGPGARPGTLLDAGRERLVVAAGEGAVELLEVQLEGGRRLEAASFARGHRPRPGEALGVESGGPGATIGPAEPGPAASRETR
jgi:methionyl-tRNA formyltransferase